MDEQEYDNAKEELSYKLDHSLINAHTYVIELKKIEDYYKKEKKLVKQQILSFGKYKGQRYSDVHKADPGYTKWMRENSIPIR